MPKNRKTAQPKTIASFSKNSILFLTKAGKQKNNQWLENPKNKNDFENFLLKPLQYLALTLKNELSALAPQYHFPQKGIGRLKRGANHIEQKGGGVYKNWFNYTAAIPPTSRFEKNPSIFFLINSEDLQDPVLLAGGLYMPSSRQMRLLREAISVDASEFKKLFATKKFKQSFKDGFSSERKSSRVPKGFDPSHPNIEWIKLQGFFVWKSYPMKVFSDKKFANIVAQDAKEILKLNELLSAITRSTPTQNSTIQTNKNSSLIDRLGDVKAPKHNLDF